MIVVDEEKIVEIPSHFFGRHQGGENIELAPFRKWRKYLRYHAHLDFVGDLQLAFDPFLRRSGFFEILDGFIQAPCHLVERSGEDANFILCWDINPLS